MQTQKIFVVDTNCLLLSCNLIFDICRKNDFKITLPQIVIDELDR
ncbi:PIN domain-containing protein [Helicobacter bilis]|nr:PIN domain-containing protein [Helicobacter bilis]MCI7410773.1 PIN domain-containing protein [Helicobacter bilis]MDD7296055.1 PIN domain-containing protein [Helicobacter bilis]MDY4399421.1 PIN domain-containing protein [Helicobacter bilis]